MPHEPDFPKREWSGFHEPHTDYHLGGVRRRVPVL